MKASRQLTLDLGHRPALEREDFLVAPSNELAVAWIDRWPDWPAQALAIYGPAGSGKTHLCQVWRRSSGAVAVNATILRAEEPPAILGEQNVCVVEGVAGVLADEPEVTRRLLHLYNMVLERGGYLLFSDRTPPARWICPLADLHSRLAGMQAVALGEPDEALVQAVLVKLFADRQLTVSPEVIQFLTPRIERSLDAARQVVASIDGRALEARRDITIPLVREVLSQRPGGGNAMNGKEEV
ncbi:DNA replication protein [Pelagibius litoralis]|uniref:DNA replication protein n=1 Tax=Pelagibius litoralis TaxID=374515 RepID=A0A967EZE2_9PROT|nr:DnaA/Hda family protein [Pelagibius litoralis]NIA70278.1 DNA replication protein [Pelagibius litoralis]